MALIEKRIACIQHIKDYPARESVGREKVRAEAGSENEKRQPFVMAGVVIEC